MSAQLESAAAVETVTVLAHLNHSPSRSSHLASFLTITYRLTRVSLLSAELATTISGLCVTYGDCYQTTLLKCLPTVLSQLASTTATHFYTQELNSRGTRGMIPQSLGWGYSILYPQILRMFQLFMFFPSCTGNTMLNPLQKSK
jgi:hypothetical protein